MNGRVIVLGTPKGHGMMAALMVDGELEDLVIDPKNPATHPMVGDVIAARITRKLPNKGGAFADLGDGLDGFLRDARDVTSGERTLLQVTSLPEPGKAVTVSPRVLFKGPNLILTPGTPGVNVSRQIKDMEDRERLTTGAEAAMEALGIDWAGLIVRTSATEAEGDILQSELGELAKQAERAEAARTSAETWRDPLGSAMHVWQRDWISPPVDQILCTPDLAKTLSTEHAGRFDGLIVQDANPLEAGGMFDALEALSIPEVPIASGSMVIEPTKALIAVDVNTGRDFSPAAGLKTNIAAIRELPRQLRLRGLGGQIVVDFAPMPKKERRGFEASVKAAFRRDIIETSLVGWTEMGLYELQRKRERWPLAELL